MSIGKGFISGEDVLGFTNQNNITGSYDFATGVLTLAGVDSTADYVAALDSVTFRTTSTAVGSRTIGWIASDGVSSSAEATSSLIVESGPQLTAGGTATFTGGGAPAILDAGLSLIDQSGQPLLSGTVTIGAALQSGDVLSFNNGTNTETFADGKTITANFNGGVLTLSGGASAADYQVAMDQVQFSFSPANADPTAGGGDTVRTISWGANDGALNSMPATSTLGVVHAPPSVIAGTPSVTFTGGGNGQALDSGLVVIAPDSSDNLTGATVTISSGLQSGDVLSFNGTNIETFADGKTVTGTYDSTTGVLTLDGTASRGDYQTVLNQVQFSFNPANGDPTAGGGDTSRGINWQVNDGIGLSSIAGATTTIKVVHAPPILIAGATARFDGHTAIALDGGLTITDADSGGNLTGATVSIDAGSIHAGFRSGDTLNFTNQNGITGNYNAATGVLTLSGSSSVVNYQSALDSITFSFTPATGDPTGGAANDADRTITWTVTDGSTSHGSATATSTLHVLPPLAPPPASAGQKPVPDNFDRGHFSDLSGMVTDAQFGGPTGLNFGAGKALYVVHSDVNTAVADNGTIGFEVALNQLETALGGDVASVTATLADGRPLPGWLHFDSDTGQFAGLLPDDIATGSIGHDDGGFNDGQGGPSLPQLMTIEVVARDSKGNLAVTDFTIDLSAPALHKADRHGWNFPPGEKIADPWGQLRPPRDLAFNSGLGPHRDVVTPHAGDRSLDRVAWHVPALDADGVRIDHGIESAPVGRAGLSDQIKSHGWHAVAAQRTALLDSLRQGVAGWR